LWKDNALNKIFLFSVDDGEFRDGRDRDGVCQLVEKLSPNTQLPDFQFCDNSPESEM
jgi:hypothetical protein